MSTIFSSKSFVWVVQEDYFGQLALPKIASQLFIQPVSATQAYF